MKYSDAILKIQKLLKEGGPKKALALALAVRKVAPLDPTVHALIKECTEMLHKRESGRRGDFVKNSIKVIKSFKKEGDIEKAVQASKELLDVAPDDTRAQKIHKKMTAIYIEAQLHNPLKKQLEENGEYEKLYQFYLKLGQIFPDYTKLKTLAKKTEKKLIEIDREHKKAFATESLAKLNEWFKEGKYEAVINGALELQAITHQGSSDAASLLKKAKRANKSEIEKQTFEFMKAQLPSLKAAYESKSEPMIKI